MRTINRDLEDEVDEDDADDEAPISSPSRANHAARRMSSATRDASPLRDITTRNAPTTASRRTQEKRSADGYSVMTSIENEYQASEPEDRDEDEAEPQFEDAQPFMDDAAGEIDDYNREAEQEEEADLDIESVEPPQQIDDEEVDQTFTPHDGKGKTTANSRRKRKSDGESSAPPASKKARKDSGKKLVRQTRNSDAAEQSAMPPPKPQNRHPLKKKDSNSQMSKRQAKELDDIVEKVRARPNPPRSLYVLRKETPADDSVTLTRSGRMSVKPLAYWRNERCVWGGSPNTELKEGTRFPLNSIKEIIRTDEHLSPLPKKYKGRKGKKKGKKGTSADLDSDVESDLNDDQTEPWETDSGTIRGIVSEWDSEQGAPLNIEQEIDIAHSSQAIQTYVPAAKSGKEPPLFRYSKLFSNEFMSVGLVDLPPGGIKKPKNAQKMQMTFYVVKGRVTASVGPVLGELTTFSIGKGGFWQVPRGESSNPKRGDGANQPQVISMLSRMSWARRRAWCSARVVR